jgi:hypothetical protein
MNDDKHNNINNGIAAKIDMWGINFFFLTLGLMVIFEAPGLVDILEKYVNWVTK